MRPYYTDSTGRIAIYHGDCWDILPELDQSDLVLTDPPYGDNMGTNRPQPGSVQYAPIAGDESIEEARRLFSWLGDRDAVVFGANNFPELLPHRGRWLCWDKRLTAKADRMLGSAFELAWTSRTSGFDSMFRCLHGGVVNDNSPGKPRLHPTEKPIRLLSDIISSLYPKAESVVDPFMGSGTTLRAAKDLGLMAIGIDLDEQHCETAAKRLAQEVLPFA